MTEAEWLQCTDPTAMLEFLRGKVSDRKLRLFAVACCRRFLHLTQDQRVGEAVDIAERFADGLVDDAERSNARKLAQEAAQVRGVVARPDAPKWQRRVASLAYYAAARQAMEAVWNVPHLAGGVLVWHQGGYNNCDSRAIFTVERAIESNSLRDIFGNPYRPVTLDPRWRTSTVIDLATAIYADRAFERLPILGDALLDAGCDSEAMIAHCREANGVHARGCWVVDLLLGKE